MVKMYRVSLSQAQRLLLQKTVSSGTASARTLAHARVLLKANEGSEGPGCTDTVIAEAVEVSVSTVARIRQWCVQEGMEAALRHRPPCPPKSCKLDGRQEAHLTALACSAPPEGRKRWTLRLLAARFAVLECGCVISYELVRRTLNRNELKPHLKQQWCIPPTVNAEFVWHMEDVLDVSPASLYAAFPPAEAKRITDKLEIHQTPKHGSWLNAAEIELAILTTQCLDQRIPDRDTLREEIAAWEADRNALGATVNWRFTTENARIKLTHLYPVHP